LFGNIVGCPVNCTKVIEALTKGIPTDSNLQVWVGAWRKGVSWNHAKIIAVDGCALHTGGHNMWTDHYLKNDPVCDLSLELEGAVAIDGHMYANEQWGFIESWQTTAIGQCVSHMPDSMVLVTRTRVIVTEWPKGVAATFPPKFRRGMVPKRERQEGDVPILTMGRYGTILNKDRPSDDAMQAMLGSATKIIRLALQDLGPVCVPGTKMPLPGCVWPKRTMATLGHVLWKKGVDVEIVLSNPGSTPGGLKPLEACYGNGWSCVDVAAEIIKAIKKEFPEAEDGDLRRKVQENLRICFIRHARGNAYDDGMTIGNHSKHFIVDDVCFYVGSQNLYICDLAEWGVLIDDRKYTRKVLEDFWKPMWSVSYVGQDVDVDAVMDGLDIDRDGEAPSMFPSAEQKKNQKLAARLQAHTPGHHTDFLDSDDDDEV
jgi:phosphatidylserine/phosphatidylglycerophosphate/cardiolipin synthase-like enzyme